MGGEPYGGEPEGRFRDRRGREHYDNGRFAPMRSEGEPPYYGDDDDDEGGSGVRHLGLIIAVSVVLVIAAAAGAIAAPILFTSVMPLSTILPQVT